MLAWPSFYAEPGATLRIYNTTQYFRSYTIFFRPDCNFNLAVTPPDNQKVKMRPTSTCSGEVQTRSQSCWFPSMAQGLEFCLGTSP